MTTTDPISLIATSCFAMAILHTFSVKLLQKKAHQYPEGSIGENLFHLLGEVEVVFGIWAGLFISAFMFMRGTAPTITYLENLNFTEPFFVFVIMSVCATRPILSLAENIILKTSRMIPINKTLSFYVTTLILGPVLGSFITEPAAMTVTALILLKRFYSHKTSEAFKYATIGLLFVNISIGGTLTPYAAPPVLMVAPKWGWDLQFMLTHFGWKAIIAVFISTLFVASRFQKEIKSFGAIDFQKTAATSIPIWVTALHLLFLVGVVLTAHHMVLFIGLFLFFLGVVTVTKEYQETLKIREALLVGFFLGGLVVLGGQQRWWLEPILSELTSFSLYIGAMTLTAFTDNAAITFLGSQVPNLSDASKYALVAGSVVGGGLTVIANAPNPAGYSTLNSSFGVDGISPWGLFKSALVPTLIAASCFWIL
jgi:hypothetical protein